MHEDKIMILQMLKDGKVTAEETLKLLEFLDKEIYKSKFTNKTLEEIGSDIGNAFGNLFANLKDIGFSMGINNLTENKLGGIIMSKESLEILNMVRDRKITPEEGEKLLDALNNNYDKSSSSNKVEFIKIKVSDPNDKDKVNLTLPITLLSTGIKLAEKFSPEFRATGLSKSDIDDILIAVKSGERGKIIDVEKDSGERVEITIS